MNKLRFIESGDPNVIRMGPVDDPDDEIELPNETTFTQYPWMIDPNNPLAVVCRVKDGLGMVATCTSRESAASVVFDHNRWERGEEPATPEEQQSVLAIHDELATFRRMHLDGALHVRRLLLLLEEMHQAAQDFKDHSKISGPDLEFERRLDAAMSVVKDEVNENHRR